MDYYNKALSNCLTSGTSSGKHISGVCHLFLWPFTTWSCKNFLFSLCESQWLTLLVQSAFDLGWQLSAYLCDHQELKEKLIFLWIKPYNRDIYDYIQCSTAILWPTVQSWELELLADVTTSWKQQRSIWPQTIHPKNTTNARFVKCLICPSCSDTKTQS